MGEPGLNNNDAAFDLIELHREVEELEAGRAGLLKRIEQARVGLRRLGTGPQGCEQRSQSSASIWLRTQLPPRTCAPSGTR